MSIPAIKWGIYVSVRPKRAKHLVFVIPIDVGHKVRSANQDPMRGATVRPVARGSGQMAVLPYSGNTDRRAQVRLVDDPALARVRLEAEKWFGSAVVSLVRRLVPGLGNLI